MNQSVRERIGLSVQPQEPAKLVETLVEIEKVGVSHIWIGGAPWEPDILTVLTAAAMRTTRLKMGTAIIQAFARHPVFLALQASSFHALAPGRLQLGIGASSPLYAKRAYGIEMDAPFAYLREYMQVLRPLLHEGAVRHQGRFLTTDIELPTTAPIPLLMAALGPKAFRLAGEIADGAISAMCPVPYLLHTALPALQEGATRAGRKCPRLVAHVPVVFTEDRETALQIGRQAMRIYTTRPNYRTMFVAAGFSLAEIEAVSERLVESLLVYGDERRIRERLLELLHTEIDELTVGLIPVADAAQEALRLARLIGEW
ncbi:putative F420-dependent oxidoreductase [Thermosporothrix hazakensis]|jgi:probable F420-dependent oxidoreductase|uniref:Putative F420-dependent oxidoreductase n=1 Tax=Thermosporothrix hazakensis TaxID=644383 RepID=A0A326U6P8_THEHA|nr:LLM class flavin-dependent oxidoreductase [Thermosporothrix hazakensis]PZW28480.1 putative F420-dependent oxidoreductase [Thermosporothrix hazakensis]GCE45255.1 LLM class F420-dependent oxidoreductase [Thermosporothrix hazakensis]